MAYVTPKGKADGSDSAGLGSQAWNVADGFTKIKILRLLIQLDLDEELALFGKKEDSDNIPDEEIPYRRVEYFDKFIFHLKQLMGNCKFSIDKGIDELIMQQFLDRIEQVEAVADGIASTYINDITKEQVLEINEPHFKNCFNILRRVKDDLNFPVNRAGLIFQQGNELDLDGIMRSIEDGE